jgi:Flp pilus assembly protein TadD
VTSRRTGNSVVGHGTASRVWLAAKRFGVGRATATLTVAAGMLLVGCQRQVPPAAESLKEMLLNDRLNLAEQRLTELDVEAARRLLDPIKLRSPDVDQLRARLALAVGDCQGALALVAAQLPSGHADALGEDSTPTGSSGVNPPSKPNSGSTRSASTSVSELPSVANGCARAMAGAEIATDEARGVWVRFQNPRDRVLLPLIADVADRAANALAAHLGTKLPRPIRIELVSDLVSLAKITGLPLEAAETTGTIAIARWGKVTMVSPRATPDGFPWQDTLAHELAHLVVSRQSDDAAPLWLQEGIAKREETRWRDPMPFDTTEDSHQLASRALREGRSIGIEHLGASIALLPTPEAAETAYAEVHDFLNYWVAKNGEAALVLLLRDLGGLRADMTPRTDAVDRAMLSVSGYSLKQWNLLWQSALLSERAAPANAVPGSSDNLAVQWDSDSARRLRLAELLEARRHYGAEVKQLAPLLERSPLPPEVSQHAAFATLELGANTNATELLNPARVHHADGSWFAVRGRALFVTGSTAQAEANFRDALAFAPTLEKVACRGYVAPPQREWDPGSNPAANQEPWATLCRSAREP